MHEHNILCITNKRGYFCLVSGENGNDEDLDYEQKVNSLFQMDYLWKRIVEKKRLVRKDFHLTEKGNGYILQAHSIGMPNLYTLTEDEWNYIEDRTFLNRNFLKEE